MRLFPSSQVSEDMLVEAAILFNENYGTWGEKSIRKGESHRPSLSTLSNAPAGHGVRLSPSRLREQYLPGAALTFYTRVTVDEFLAGNAFACRWEHGSKTVCWMTQLVVRKEYRERGLAGGLLRMLRAGGRR